MKPLYRIYTEPTKRMVLVVCGIYPLLGNDLSFHADAKDVDGLECHAEGGALVDSAGTSAQCRYRRILQYLPMHVYMYAYMFMYMYVCVHVYVDMKKCM